MTQCGGIWSWPFWLTAAFGIGGAIITLSGNCALAQKIKPDATLGSERSAVTRNVLIEGLSSDRIDGGAKRGANLFHSFEEFSINEGQGAYFTNPIGIENILSRVTGDSRSDIQGTLGVLGKANLFLINPNGIIFGPNASLDVGGSFIGTTANAVGLANEDVFSTDLTESFPSQLLNVNPDAFWFNQIATQPIIDRSIASSAVLQVLANQSLLLLGSEVRVDGPALASFDSHVELGAVAGTGIVGLNVSGSILSLSVPKNIQLGDVYVTNSDEVDVSEVSGGIIEVKAQKINYERDVLENPPDIVQTRLSLLAVPLKQLVDVSRLITQTCPAGSGPRQSKFVFTGRGGLPPNPGETLSTDAVQVDLVTLNPDVNKSSNTVVSSPTRPESAPMVEAQGWIIDAKGNVVLTANAPAVNPHGSWQKTAKCQSSNRSQNVETVANPPISGKDRMRMKARP